jgi:hypothetical protein
MPRTLIEVAARWVAGPCLVLSAILGGCEKPVETPATKFVPKQTASTSPPSSSESKPATEPTPPPPAKRQPKRLNDLVGVWNWGWGDHPTKKPVMRTSVTFFADGTVVQAKTGKKGVWELADSELKIDWEDKNWSRMTLSPDGLSMEGKNNFGLQTIAKKRPAKGAK